MKKPLLESATDVFSHGKAREKQHLEELTSELYKQIGQFKIELAWPKNMLLTLVPKRKESLK